MLTSAGSIHSTRSFSHCKIVKLTTFDAARRGIENGETTCEQLTGNALLEIRQGTHLNAFLTVFDEGAMLQARAVDRKIRDGSAGKLAGMVMAIKDVICMKDARVTCGSRILESFVALYDATVIRRLAAEDVVFVGKTNMDEFAMGSSSENSAYGPVLNPVDASRVPGGSSSGSAVAVAVGMAHAALGSDTGGSIRQPASFCGVVGLKPTYGRVSRYGLVALSSSFDQIGPFANSVADAARVLETITGHDERDSTSAKLPPGEYLASLTNDVKGRKIGLPDEALGEGLNSEVRSSVELCLDRLRNAGAEIRTIRLPHAQYHLATYYVLMTAEASSNLARYDGARYGYRTSDGKDLLDTYVKSRSEGFGPEVKRRIMLGTYVLSAGYYDAYYRKAQRVRRLIQKDFLDAFTSVDCILMPTAPTTAFRFEEKTEDPLQMYLSDIYTVSANLAGNPGISVPCGKDHHGLPIGVQLVGKHFDEATILNVASFLERESVS